MEPQKVLDRREQGAPFPGHGRGAARVARQQGQDADAGAKRRREPGRPHRRSSSSRRRDASSDANAGRPQGPLCLGGECGGSYSGDGGKRKRAVSEPSLDGAWERIQARERPHPCCRRACSSSSNRLRDRHRCAGPGDGHRRRLRLLGEARPQREVQALPPRVGPSRSVKVERELLGRVSVLSASASAPFFHPQVRPQQGLPARAAPEGGGGAVLADRGLDVRHEAL